MSTIQEFRNLFRYISDSSQNHIVISVCGGGENYIHCQRGIYVKKILLIKICFILFTLMGDHLQFTDSKILHISLIL
jgi:hypothetical protein